MIRAATKADIPAIAAIWNPVIKDTAITFNPVAKSLKDLENMLTEKARDGHALLVVQAAQEVVGFGSYGQFRAGLGYAQSMEHSIYLTRAARGKGLGRALLCALEDHARGAGAHVMMAGIAADNSAGRAFHKACAYQFLALVPQVGYKFGRYHDLVLMQKILT